MENKTYYKVYAIDRFGKKNLVASYTDPLEAHRIAQKYSTIFNQIIIDKSSKPD